jgi:PEP-CTERM motif
LRTNKLVLIALACLTLLTASAKANTLLFSFSGPNADTITFTLPSSPSADNVHAAYEAFFLHVDMQWNGRPVQTAGVFRESSQDGGFTMIYSPAENTNTNTIQSFFSGPQLFTGPLNQPTFLLGTFNLVELSNNVGPGIPGGFGPGVLTITDPSAPAVPEPASLLLVGSGALCFIGGVRKRIGRA